MAVDPAAAARWIVSRHERWRKALRRRLQSAQEDAARIISAIAAQYRPHLEAGRADLLRRFGAVAWEDGDRPPRIAKPSQRSG